MMMTCRSMWGFMTMMIMIIMTMSSLSFGQQTIETTMTTSSSSSLSLSSPSNNDIPDILILIATQSFTAEDLVEDILLDILQQHSSSCWTVQVALVDEAGLDWRQSSSNAGDVGGQQQQQQHDNTSLWLLATAAKVVLIVASTYADGDPPNHATEFAVWLQQQQQQIGMEKKENHELGTSNTNPTTTTTATTPFAVFALGDSKYDHYCAFGEWIDQTLQGTTNNNNNQCRMTRLLPLHRGDAQADQAGAFRVWSEQVITALLLLQQQQQVLLPNCTKQAEEEEEEEAEAPSLSLQQLQQQQEENKQPKAVARTRPFRSTGADWRRSALPLDCITATLMGKEHLTANNDDHLVRHISLQLPTPTAADAAAAAAAITDLQPGDYIGIYPHNHPSMVQRALNWLQIDTNKNHMPTTKILEQQQQQQSLAWKEKSLTAHEFLTKHVDLTGKANPSTLRALLPFVGTLELRALAKNLTAISKNEANSTTTLFDQWVGGRWLTKLDLVEMFECRPSVQALARATGPMQPRLYSIASLQYDSNSTTVVGLCMAIAKGGLCTNYIGNLDLGSKVTVFTRKTQFHYAADNTPTLLVAAGSGIGPYIGFLEQSTKSREIAEVSPSPKTTTTIPNTLSNTRLFFGCRTPDDILYRDRLSVLEEQGLHLQYAFSRMFGQPRMYAQDLIGKESAFIWTNVFQKKGRVFVCGRLELCADVRQALVDVARFFGGLSEIDARQLVHDMEKEGRFRTDCWSVGPSSTNVHVDVTSTQSLPQLPKAVAWNQSSVDLSTIPAWPSYLRLVASGEFEHRIEQAQQMASSCVACGRFCEVNRLSSNPNDWGECRVGEQALVFDADAHFGEEECLKGTHGSGTIFFAACNLKCMYCQNWQISMTDRGHLVDDERLAEMMLMLQERGCHNINLVSPTHNVLAILRGIFLAAKKGLKLPIVWNTGGYDSVASLRLLDGIVDIYMPDSKYASRSVARKLSKVDNYPEINQAAIKEMHRQVGALQIDPRTGLAYRGVLVRHLVLPSNLGGTPDITAFLAREVSRDTYTNVLPYYRPEYEAANDRKFGLARRPTNKEIQDAEKAARCACLERLHGKEKESGCSSLLVDADEQHCSLPTYRSSQQSS